MELSPWILLLLSLPVLLLGDWLLKHVRVLSRFHIPSPVAGGLVISAIVLLINLFVNPLAFQSAVDARWWTWLTTIEPEWIKGKSQGISLLFMIGFFTCIGLNATWLLLKRGGIQVALFLGLATLLAVFQNGI